jgi:hypothetical protein
MRIGIVLMPIGIGINIEIRIRIGIKTMLIHNTADEQKITRTANTKRDCLCCLFLAMKSVAIPEGKWR